MFRTAARYLTEPHPFARNPTSVRPHAVDYTLYPRRIARTGKLYVPLPYQTSVTLLTYVNQRYARSFIHPRMARGRRGVRSSGWDVTL